MHIKIIIFCCLTTIILGCTVKEYEGIKIPYSIQIREDFLDRKVRNVIKSSLPKLFDSCIKEALLRYKSLVTFFA